VVEVNGVDLSETLSPKVSNLGFKYHFVEIFHEMFYKLRKPGE